MKPKILDEINLTQGKALDIGGYYKPCFEKADALMRPNQTLNQAIQALI